MAILYYYVLVFPFITITPPECQPWFVRSDQMNDFGSKATVSSLIIENAHLMHNFHAVHGLMTQGISKTLFL